MPRRNAPLHRLRLLAFEANLPATPPMVEVGPLAGWLHLAAMCYCRLNSTDGYLPHAQVPLLVNWAGVAMADGEGAWEPPDPYALARKLVAAGLWSRLGSRGYVIVGYLLANMTQQEIEKEAARRHVWMRQRREQLKQGRIQVGRVPSGAGRGDQSWRGDDSTPALLSEGVGTQNGIHVGTQKGTYDLTEGHADEDYLVRAKVDAHGVSPEEGDLVRAKVCAQPDSPILDTELTPPTGCSTFSGTRSPELPATGLAGRRNRELPAPGDLAAGPDLSGTALSPAGESFPAGTGSLPQPETIRSDPTPLPPSPTRARVGGDLLPEPLPELPSIKSRAQRLAHQHARLPAVPSAQLALDLIGGTPGAEPADVRQARAATVKAKVRRTDAKQTGGGLKVKAFLDAVYALDPALTVTMTQRNAGAIAKCSADPALVARAYVDARYKRWGDSWLWQNLSVWAVIDRLDSYRPRARSVAELEADIASPRYGGEGADGTESHE